MSFTFWNQTNTFTQASKDTSPQQDQRNTTAERTLLTSPCLAKSYLVLFVFVLGVTGNAYLVWVIVTVRQLCTFTYSFVLNLAISDCLKGLMFITLTTTEYIYHDVHENVPQFFHNVVFAILSYTYLVSVFLTLLLAIERYISCVYGIRREVILTDKRVLIMAVSAWILPFIPLVSTLSLDSETGTQQCSQNKSISSYSNAIILAVVFLIIVCVYAQLYRLSKKHIRRIRALRASVGNEINNISRIREDLKVAFVASVISLEIGIFLLPRSVFVILLETGRCNAMCRAGLRIANLLLALHPIANVLVYSLGMKQLREVIKGKLLKIFAVKSNQADVPEHLEMCTTKQIAVKSLSCTN